MRIIGDREQAGIAFAYIPGDVGQGRAVDRKRCEVISQVIFCIAEQY